MLYLDFIYFVYVSFLFEKEYFWIIKGILINFIFNCFKICLYLDLRVVGFCKNDNF